MSCQVFQKDIGGKRRIIIDWSPWLGASEVVSAAWTVPAQLTESDSSITTTTTTNYFSGGTDGQSYDVKCCMTTNDAVARIRCITFAIEIGARCN